MRHNQKQQGSRGFTLIELMLAMAFFSSILIVSTVVLVQIFGIYNKGIAVKQINSVGRTLTDDIIRVGNSSSGTIAVTSFDSNGTTHPRCLKLGSNVYIWSYAYDQVTDTSHVYTTGSVSSPELVTFSRLNKDAADPINTPATCPAPGFISVDRLEPILSTNVRVYDADIKAIGDGGNLLRFKLVLGTYGGPGSSNNPTIDGAGAVSCGPGTLGNFCSFGTYDTVIYLPNV